jgi:hypothetical protein
MRPFKDSASTNSEVYLALVATIEAAYAVSAWFQRADPERVNDFETAGVRV